MEKAAQRAALGSVCPMCALWEHLKWQLLSDISDLNSPWPPLHRNLLLCLSIAHQQKYTYFNTFLKWFLGDKLHETSRGRVWWLGLKYEIREMSVPIFCLRPRQNTCLRVAIHTWVFLPSAVFVALWECLGKKVNCHHFLYFHPHHWTTWASGSSAFQFPFLCDPWAVLNIRKLRWLSWSLFVTPSLI